jgi:hypothetical protein
MTTGQNGDVVTLVERLADVEQRHGSQSPGVRALHLARVELERAVGAIEALLRRGR